MWGIIFFIVGLFLLVSASLKSENRIYRILTARDTWLWKHNTHRFHQFSGVLLIVIGILLVLGDI